MKKYLPLFLIAGQLFASTRVVTTSSAPRIQRTPNYGPEITRAAQIVRELTTNATFLCGHINPKLIGEPRVEVSEITSPGRADRYLLEVFADFEC